MLEYFTYKKVKKHQAEKRAREEAATASLKPVLSLDDERFIENLVAEGTPPALPQRPIILNQDSDEVKQNTSQLERSVSKGKTKENDNGPTKPKKKENRFSLLFAKSKKDGTDVKDSLPVAEVEREEDDITRVLNDLNMSAVNNRALSLSKESSELMHNFTTVLKDLVNGVPTAYDDLTHLLDDSQGTIAKNYDHLPSFLKKLIASLPQKLTSSLAPELLATAAEAEKLSADGTGAAAAGGFMGAAKGFLKPNGLRDLIAKPGAVAGMLKSIMNALKLRWPAFMGTNVLLSLGLFGRLSHPLDPLYFLTLIVLLFVFWYCHKRGREVRLAAEGKVQVVDSEGRIVELEDDPALEFSTASRADSKRRSHDSRRHGGSSKTSSPRRRSQDSRRLDRSSNKSPSPRRKSYDSRRLDAS